MGRLRPQDDIACAAIHCGVQIRPKPGIQRHFPGAVFYIDQFVKIDYFRTGGTPQDGALFYLYILGPQHDAVTGIDPAFYFNFFPFCELQPCIFVVTVSVCYLQAYNAIVTVSVPSAVILKVSKIIHYISFIVPQLIPIGSSRDEGPKPSRVDDARLADRHAVRADKIKVAVNFAVPDGVYRTVNINFTVDKIDQVCDVNRLVLFIEMHVGDIAGTDFIFIKLVHTGFVIVQHILHIKIVHFSVACQVIAVCVLNGTGKTGCRLQQDACRQHRRRPPGCRTGVGRRLPVRGKNLLHPCHIPQRCSLYPRRQARHAGCQALNNGTDIIFTAVLCNFRHNHVTFSCVVPDDFVNFIHNSVSCTASQEINKRQNIVISILAKQ